AIGWGTFARTQQAGWLALAMAYAMGKYLFVLMTTGPGTGEGPERPDASGREDGAAGSDWDWPRRLIRGLGHADLRWHLWIVLAALGRVELALAAYAAYFPIRSLAVATRRAVRHA